MSDWIARQQHKRREREHREHARRVKLWAIESETHEAGCACWDCVLDLAAAVMRHQAEMLVRGASRRRPMVRP